jgi:polar amino acid transport system substrate-binding protein
LRIFTERTIFRTATYLCAAILLAQFAVRPVSAVEHLFRMSAPHLPGVSQPDGNGSLDIFVAELFRRIGVEFETVYLPDKRAKETLIQGKVDGYLTGTPSFRAMAPNAIMVHEPFMTVDYVAISRDSAFRFSGWDELSKYSIAYLRGHEYFSQHVTNTDDRIVLLNDYVDLKNYFLKRTVDRGGVSFVLMAREIAVATFGEDLGRSVFIVEPPLGSISRHIFVHERHRDLVPRLDRAIRNMHRDVTTDRIPKMAKAY